MRREIQRKTDKIGALVSVGIVLVLMWDIAEAGLSFRTTYGAVLFAIRGRNWLVGSMSFFCLSGSSPRHATTVWRTDQTILLFIQ